ncbi:MAG: CtsR family transcriptional regulator [Gemella haemolysans]|jgi:transcriptional regulator ctsR|uniref:Transcriptional regulator CtsR domain protein n=1 Tax=Gemella haemolysans TaxID=1379 RepID=A0A133ZWA7_9BACL|nr:CtsR family transcriptional regulator [Gemella haemolysans]TKW63684.1 MAG: CtsR family transcriptional regulator [Gemella sp.]KXB59715.1 transcriptional regulator CtsR domain protein [Gemella haemolysans]MBS5319345.1 CtsR family transcriptional regulator [Gemella haemolysans]MDU3831734.1 CtsR family transcriptional regulator [Gemella haemolysans]MDU6766482.1 CtsR family transcriptional regulator [Gemella haemolysans]
MNNNMTDILEQYIMNLFKEATEDHIIIKRSNVAQKFDCVPSQLNYVIKTRFTPEHGFIIESKRGGGGFIRITKITLHTNKDYIDYLIETVDNEIIEVEEAMRLAKILLEKEYIDKFDYNHFIDSIEIISSVHNQFLDYIDENSAEEMINQTKSNIKDLTIRFLTNIKYNKRG